jgi:hypothetical protein
LTAEATDFAGSVLRGIGRALLSSRLGSGALFLDVAESRSFSGLGRFVGSFFEGFTLFATDSSSEGTSNISGPAAVARMLPKNAPFFNPSPGLFNDPCRAVLCFRGRSGEGASLSDAGAGIDARRDDLP